MSLVGLLHDGDRDGIAQFHDVIHEHFDVISAGLLKFHLSKNSDVGGVKGGVFEREFYFTLAQHGGLVRRNEAHTFGKVADASGPAVEAAKLHSGDWQLRDADEVNDANKEEISIHFLANFFAKQ